MLLFAKRRTCTFILDDMKWNLVSTGNPTDEQIPKKRPPAIKTDVIIFTIHVISCPYGDMALVWCKFQFNSLFIIQMNMLDSIPWKFYE